MFSNRLSMVLSMDALEQTLSDALEQALQMLSSKLSKDALEAGRPARSETTRNRARDRRTIGYKAG